MTDDPFAYLGLPHDADVDTVQQEVDARINSLKKEERRKSTEQARKDEIHEELINLNNLSNLLKDPDEWAVLVGDFMGPGGSPRPIVEPAGASGSSGSGRRPSLGRGDATHDHSSIYRGQLVTGFGLGRLVSKRTVSDGDLLTIRFSDGEREIVAWHPGLVALER